MSMHLRCRCGYRTPDLGDLLDHQATGHGDYRFVGPEHGHQAQDTPDVRAQVARAERRLAERHAAELAGTTRATPRPVEPWERDPPPRPRAAPVAPTPAQIAWTKADRERARARIAARRDRLAAND
jgi:hypothetical protein